MSLNKLSKECYKIANEKGFWESTNISEKLMLIVSELGEACEALRKDKRANKREIRVDFEKHIKDTFEDEMADTIIRILDLCGYLKVDIDWHIKAKMEYNKTRGFKHGKKF